MFRGPILLKNKLFNKNKEAWLSVYQPLVDREVENENA